ncbi:restriction endonuclease subunit S [Prevotella sp. PCHR]|uniref:Restriction endonuclease subunit S n=1 Tax=Xylanibacter caecicola TaxID=2736294 RepID=A0ABX2B0V1_9BACT|nr:restriction endonuclease subunit S [Xylanibacter caecicola]NPE25139.1 restriction endonuclease subunit S [Xylanibacter caecicola]
MAENKDKKVLNVPHLRFPEFSGEWEEHTLSQYLEFKNGLNPDAKRIGSGLPFISVMDILSEGVINYDNIRGKVNATEKEIECFGVKDGDVLFQRSSETLEDVGRANVYMDNRTAIYGGFVIRGRKIGNYAPLFFKYLLATPLARKRTCKMGAGAQHFNIGQEGLSKISLYFPSIEEQRKIAGFLSLIDERIATQNKIIEKYESLIKGIAQHCIKESISGITYVKLGDICQITTGKLDANAQVDNGIYPFFTCAEKPFKIDNFAFDTEALLISGNGANLGYINYYKGKFNAYQRTYVLDLFSENIQYIKWALKVLLPKRIAIEKSLSNTPYIVLSTLTDLRLPLPCKSEQSFIANLMQSLERILSIQIAQYDSYNYLKQYLLRQMFI